MKEIEKIAPQQKRIPLPSVKEILQSLVDDNIVPIFQTLPKLQFLTVQVSSDKIGTTIYYWAFPSHAKRNRQSKIEDLNKELHALKEQKQNIAHLIKDASGTPEDSVSQVIFLA